MGVDFVSYFGTSTTRRGNDDDSDSLGFLGGPRLLRGYLALALAVGTGFLSTVASDDADSSSTSLDGILVRRDAKFSSVRRKLTVTNYVDVTAINF